MMRYLLDSNVFIQAKNVHYGFDLCPGFWAWLRLANQAGRAFSVEQVATELLGHEDELAAWADAQGEEFFLPSSADLYPSLVAVAAWLEAQPYERAARDVFLEAADYYLVARAHAVTATVVTHEKPAESRRKVKIPNVCLGLGVRYMSVHDMLRRERVRLVLATGAHPAEPPALGS